MAGTFKFELVSPERVMLSVDAEQVELPGSDGDFTVLPGHAPVVATLRPGTIHSRTATEKKAIYVKNGFVEVRPDSVVVLADSAFVVVRMVIAKAVRHDNVRVPFPDHAW